MLAVFSEVSVNSECMQPLDDLRNVWDKGSWLILPQSSTLHAYLPSTDALARRPELRTDNFVMHCVSIRASNQAAVSLHLGLLRCLVELVFWD